MRRTQVLPYHQNDVVPDLHECWKRSAVIVANWR